VPENCLPYTIGDPQPTHAGALTFNTVAQVQNFLGGGVPRGRLINANSNPNRRSDGGALARQTLTLWLNLCQCPELGNMVLCGFAEGNNCACSGSRFDRGAGGLPQREDRLGDPGGGERSAWDGDSFSAG
jgi:hypothetical protein